MNYGTTEITTGSDGVFTFGEINLNGKYALIKAQKSGYFNGFRTFNPTANAFNFIGMQLMTKGNVKTFSATSGGQLADSDIQLNFPKNSIVSKDGSNYGGNVQVYSRYLAPTVENLSQIMPGMLAGLTDANTIDALVSYGMLTVELEDAAGNELEIAADATVEVQMPASINAPATIPLWHFNENYGLWIEAGTATKTGDKYIAEVNHFSTWNLDTKEDPFDVEVTLQDPNSNSITNQRVDVYNVNSNLLATVYTDNEGKFTLLRAPQNLAFRIVFECDIEEIAAQDISSGFVTLSATLANNTARSYTFNGQLSDCDVNETVIYYSNTYFTIVSNNTDDNIFFGGISDGNGNYNLTTILCDVGESTVYTLKATVSVSNNTIKDTLINVSFAGNSQSQNLDFCGTATDSIGDDFVIPFVDANLEQGVRDAINKPTGDIVYGDIKNLDSLLIFPLNPNQGTTILKGIEYFTSLTQLYLIQNSIIDLSPLSGLTNLAKLSLASNNSIVDISPLSSLTNLTFLNLSENSIVDVSALSSLTELTDLYLYRNSITDVSSLSGLTNLTYLNLSDNSINDISPLSGLTNLTYFSLNHNPVNSISPLSSLTNLTQLYLDNIYLTDVSPLSGLTNLSKLYIRLNSLNDVSPLSSLTSLKHLYLTNNFISNISSLSGLTSLTELILSGNLISDVSPLSGLANLDFLSLKYNSISDISPLCGLGNSFEGQISLSQNPLTDMDIDDLESCLPNAAIEF